MRLARLLEAVSFWNAEFETPGGVALPEEEEAEAFCFVGDFVGDWRIN